MAKNSKEDHDMELHALKSEMATISRRVEEVITILGGNSAYGLTGMKSDFRDLKTEVHNIKQEIEKIKRQDEEEKKRENFFSIRLDTLPQRIIAFVAFIAVLISIAQGFKSLFVK